ncbi:phage baseplate assembly protein V [Thermosipho sp. (in: thermotogales)]|uniref:phage baseplate assembly protein V n=1 Tax=Thermosipho sp. (in: thermotogales) TaxID=1968895 RepID=UPI00257A79B1|nr:phage baseplate assembly protein V [Thermosipho sp. (in: thermotogales)]
MINVPDFESILTPNQDARYWGKYQAIVADINDPEKRGRIRVRQPFFYGNELSPWALPCVPYGGSNNIGQFFTPEVGSGVWIEFQYGLISNPIWTGFWFAKPNGVSELPSETQGKPYIKVLKTKKVVLTIDDDTGNVEVRNINTGKSVIIKSDGLDPNGIVQDPEHRFVTDTEKETWNTIKAGSIVEDSLINGNIKVDGVEINVYTHPESHPANMITTDTNNMFVSQSEKDNWNSKLSSIPIASPTIIGGIKSGGDISVDSNGVVSINDNSHNHTKSNITDFSHSHTKSDITDFSHSHQTTDIINFDSAVSGNVDVVANTSARHTHSNKSLLDTYTQTEANLADAVSKKHLQNTDNTLTSSTVNTVNTTGIGNIVDFKVNNTTKTSIDNSGNFTGNAATASKLQTARTVTLSGDVSGSASFDGSSNITINTTVADDSHNHSSTTGNFQVGGNLSVTGDLIVNGTTFTVNSNTVTVDDPILTLGGDTDPVIDDNKDRGIEFRWHNGSVAKKGFFGFDDSTGKFIFIPDATNTSEVFSGTKGEIDANVDWNNVINKPSSYTPSTHTHTSSEISDATSSNTANTIVKRDTSGNFSAGTITATLNGNASTATKLQTSRIVSLTGGVTGSASFDGSSNITINTTVVDNSHNHTKSNITDFAHTHLISDVTNLQTSLDTKADVSNVLTKNNTIAYTPTDLYHPATKKYVDDIVVSIGTGDMLKSVYDTNNDGVVDNSEKLNGHPSTDFVLKSGDTMTGDLNVSGNVITPNNVRCENLYLGEAGGSVIKGNIYNLDAIYGANDIRLGVGSTIYHFMNSTGLALGKASAPSSTLDVNGDILVKSKYKLTYNSSEDSLDFVYV